VKKYLFVMFAMLVGLGYCGLTLDRLPPEEERWCIEFRPQLSRQECGEEFGY